MLKRIKEEITMEFEKNRGYVFVAYHKPFSMLDQSFVVPVYAGKACTKDLKDVKYTPENHEWLSSKMIGDDTGENISIRNHELNECTVLYWVWKNLHLNEFKYIGMLQYRRQLILNDFYEKAPNDIEKKAYKCVHFQRASSRLCTQIGLTDDNICKLLENYDCILPYESDLEEMKISNVYEDWVRKIPGVHIDDLIALERVIQQIHPEMAADFSQYLNGPKKRMYEMFIAPPKIVDEYCGWLFDILFRLDSEIDTTLYSVNGKRTLGYLAEVLYGFYFSYMIKHNGLRVKECGVTFIKE